MVDDLAIREVMTREFVGVNEGDTLRDAAELMLEEDQGAVAVLRGSKPVGMVLERQVLGALLDGLNADDTTIDQIMQRPPSTLPPETGIAEAAAVLADATTDHVFVGRNGDLMGILSENDLITAVTAMLTTDRDEEFDDYAGEQEVSDDAHSEMSSSQSVCEICGTLKADLAAVDGQLVCSDCRAF